MSRFGFVGPTYQSQSVNADDQVCMNWYPEVDESGNGKSALVLYPTPGLKTFATLVGKRQCRGLFTCSVGIQGERCFAVGDDTLYEVLKNGTVNVLGQSANGVTTSIGNDQKPVSWAVNNANQLIVCSAGNLWIYALSGAATTTVPVTYPIQLVEVDNPSGNLINQMILQPTPEEYAITLIKEQPPMDITTISEASNVVTVVIPNPGLNGWPSPRVGDQIQIAGVTTTGYNGTFAVVSSITSGSTCTFTYICPTTGLDPDSTGTANSPYAFCKLLQQPMISLGQQVLVSGISSGWVDGDPWTVISGPYFDGTYWDLYLVSGTAFNLGSATSGNLVSNSGGAPTNVVASTTDTPNFEVGALLLLENFTGYLALFNGQQVTVLTTADSGFTFSWPVGLTGGDYPADGGCAVDGSQAYATCYLPGSCTYTAGNQVTISESTPYANINGVWTLLEVDSTPGGIHGNSDFIIQIGTHAPYGPNGDTASAVSTGTEPLEALTQVSPQGPISFVDFIDGYFIALKANSQDFQISQLEDGTVWDPTDVYQVEEFPDNVLSMIVSEEIVWFFGTRKTIPYWDSGAALAPFVPITGVLIEQGIAAPNSRVKLDNSIFWIGADERGQGVAWRGQGYTPVRVSNHAIEYAWSQYPTISDAVGYAEQDQGHSFWVIDFPTAQATWVYDVATGLWHQRDAWVNGVSKSHPSWVHVFCFGKHLVGDPGTGNIYDMSIDYYDNAGAVIRRVRRAPHVSDELEYVRHMQLQVYLESGLATFPGGPATGVPFFVLEDVNGQNWLFQMNDNGTLASQETGAPVATNVWQDLSDPAVFWQAVVNAQGMIVDFIQVPIPAQYYQTLLMITVPSALQGALYVTDTGAGQGILQSSNPTSPPRGGWLSLRWSSDGGHTWSNPYPLDCGQVGQYRHRAIKRRLGRARDRIYEITATDAMPWRIVDAYLKATPGFQPQERLNDQLRKVG